MLTLPLLFASLALAAETPLPPKLDMQVFSGTSFLPAASPDGTLVAAGDPTGVNIWKVGGSRPVARVDLKGSAQDTQVLPLAISRDNTRVFFFRKYFTGSGGTIELAMGDIATGNVITVTKPRKLHCLESKHSMYRCERVGTGVFSPDGREGLYRAWYNGAGDSSVREDFVLSEKGRLRSTRITSRLDADASAWVDEKGGEQSDPQYGPDGKRLAVRSEGSFCAVVESDSGKRRTFLDDCSASRFPRVSLSLDGTRAIGPLKDKAGVAVWDAVGGRLLREHRFSTQAPYQLDSHAVDPFGRYLVEEHELKAGGKVVAARLVLIELATGKTLDTTESALDDSLYLHGAAADGTAIFQRKGTVVLWSFKSKAPAGPAAPIAAVADVPGVDVDKVPASSLKFDPDAYAVVIGVERYRQSGIPAVDFASRDASSMRDYLVGSMGYDARNVVLLTDAGAGRTDLEKHLGKWLRNRVQAKSRVFIYYAGHGAPDPATGEAYLLPYEADPSYLEETAYPLAKLREELGKLPSKDVTVVLDACFSGQGPRSLIAQGARPLVIAKPVTASTNGQVIAAASSSQISLSHREGRHGLLTYYLLEGLHGGADADKDGSITASEAFAYASPAVERAARLQNAEQTPTIAGAASARPWVVLKK